MASPILYDLSDKNTVIAFNPIVGVPFLLSGFAEKEIIEFDNIELANAFVGADGTMAAYTMPAIVTGRVKLLATVPAVNDLINFTLLQNQIGFIIPGGVIISTGALTISYKNFVWTSGFPGYTLKEFNQSLTWGFKAELPDTTNISSAISIIEGLLG